jgi:NAD(P)H-hydrate epimerase
MVRGVAAAADVDAMAARASVLAVGPGIGRAAWGRELFEAALAARKPIVIDADALNLLAEHPRPLDVDAVLTPHPGEAARLLGTTSGDVEHDRFAAAAAIATRYRAAVVLKGVGSIIAVPDHVVGVCLDGNPGMATAGMGDVLTGVVAGVLAQDLLPVEALELGVTLHAAAGDHAAAQGGIRGLLAADVLAALRDVLNPDDAAR